MTPIPTHICLFNKEDHEGDVFRGQDVYRRSPSSENICCDFKGRRSSLGSFVSSNNAAGKGVGDDGEDITTRRRSWSESLFSIRDNEVDKEGEGGEQIATTRWSSLGSLFSKRGRETNGSRHNSRQDQEACHNVIRGDTEGVCHSPQSAAEFRENAADGAYNTGYEENINSSATAEDDRSNGGIVEFFYSRRRSTCSRRTANTLRTSETSATRSELLMQTHSFDIRRYSAVAMDINDEDSSHDSEEGLDDSIATDDALLLHTHIEAPQDTNVNQINMSMSSNNLLDDSIATDDAILLHRHFEAPQDTNGKQKHMSKSCNKLQSDIMMSNRGSLLVEWGAWYEDDSVNSPFPLLRLK